MIIIAGIRTSVNLIDNMSNVLNRIVGNTDKMKQSIDNVQNTMNKRTEFAKNLSRDEQKLELLGARYAHQAKVVQKLNAEYQKSILNKGRDADVTQKLKGQLLSARMTELKLAEAVEKAGKKFEDQNNQMKKNIDTSGNLINKIKNLAGAYISFKATQKLIKNTVGAAAELNQQSAVMQAAFGNKDIGKGYFNRLQVYAIDTRQDIEDLTDVTRNFMQLTKNTNKLMGLTDIANRMSMRTGNIGSAESLMQEAMRGQYSRLQRSLHLTDSQIEPLKKAVQKGSLDGIIGAFDQVLNTAGLTDEIVQAFQNSPLQKFYKIIDNTKKRLAETGQMALQQFEPLLDKINSWFLSDGATQFFNGISVGIDLIAQGFIWLSEQVPIVINFISEGFNIAGQIAQTFGTILMGLSPIIIGMAIAWGIYNGVLFIMQARTLAVATATKIATGAQKLFNIALSLNPIGLVIAAIGGLIAAMLMFGKVTQGIRKLFSDAFGFMVDAAEKAVNAVLGILNVAIKAINKVSGFFGGLLGVEAKQIQELEYRADFKAFKESGQDLIENITLDGVKAKLGLDKFNQDPTTDAINNFADQEAAYNAMQKDTLGNIDDTGKKLKNSVDKSNEDLQWMRDIAEQETVNRFTAATLAPQISVQFGDVRETADVDGIVAHLEEVLTEQINIAAEGVHL